MEKTAVKTPSREPPVPTQPKARSRVWQRIKQVTVVSLAAAAAVAVIGAGALTISSIPRKTDSTLCEKFNRE